MMLTHAGESRPPIYPTDPARRGKRRLSLALQGGGSFGAFTWGVLDRLLEEEDLTFDRVSGASAGAVNAVLLSSGLARGGRAEARATLERFWHKVADTSRRNPFLTPDFMVATATRMSPYQFNPLDLNPLRDLLAEEVDFEAVRTVAPVRLLISATRVSDGALRIFRTRNISMEVVLASACLPRLHHAVEIEGEPHWDGGYAANPPLIQLVSASRAADVVVVQLIPTDRPDLPTTTSEIDKRLNQITFNNSLQKDLEALGMMMKLTRSESEASSRLGRKLNKLRLHRISAEDHVDGLIRSSALNTDWAFLTHLRDHGREAAEGLLQSGRLFASKREEADAAH